MIKTMISKRSACALVALALPLVGCSDILLVNDPDVVTPESLESEIGLQTLRNGALGEFTLAYAGGGSTDGIIMGSGLFSDEWMHSGTFTSRFQEEIRQITDDNGTLNGMYRRLHQARKSAEGAAAALAAAPTAGSDERIGEMYMYAGFTYIAFAENYCNGVPFTEEVDGVTEFGQPETNVQIYDRAIARFSTAIADASVAADVADAARIGMARAMLDKGDFAGAASAVTGIADDFAKVHNHSENSAGQRNSIFELNVSVGRWSLGDVEGVNGLDFRTAGDPRIQSALCAGCAFDTSQQVPGTPAVGDNWQFTNYTSRVESVPLATGLEARLIEAENLLQSDPVGWLAALNALRANYATYQPIIRGDPSGLFADSTDITTAVLVDPGTQAGREDLHFRERAFWLHSTGHRLSDLRRLIRQYGRGTESVFPTGVYWKPGANYNTAVSYVPGEDERNNPNYSGCLDLNP